MLSSATAVLTRCLCWTDEEEEEDDEDEEDAEELHTDLEPRRTGIRLR